MDDIVKQALAKWPDVPDCYGWLGLDARGNWFMRDEKTQALGPFREGGLARGAQLQHAKLMEFIGRNYEVDPGGCWFFQNGPQRVYVELEATPLIWRIGADFAIHDHIGRPALMQQCLLDESGRLYLQTNIGFGLVHTMDMDCAANALEQRHWPLQEVLGAELPERYGYVMSPHTLQKR